MSRHATILLVEDERDLREILTAALAKEGHEVVESSDGEGALELIRKKKIDLLLSDVVLGDISGLELLRGVRKLDPHLPVVLMSGFGTIKTAVEAMKLGACDYLAKPFEINDLRRIVEQALALRADGHEPTVTAYKPRSLKLNGIVGQGKWKEEIAEAIARVASSRATVLLYGESGTGKELVARAIHANSPRHNRPFIAVACGALPRDLLESELFGHEKGAFTGAVAMKPGRFELADQGTLFLDEISEIPLDLQVKLLRVLQERAFERIGGVRTLKVDVRVLAASNRKLTDAVREGSFREDLYYRLHVVQIDLPPLRRKKEDIPILTDYFLAKFSRENGRALKEISAAAMELFLTHTWPGNVRELENALEHAVVMAPHDATVLEADSLPASLNKARKKPASAQTRRRSEKGIFAAGV